jgi:citrate synthase
MVKNSTEMATLYIRGQEVKLPVLEDTFKNVFVDTSKLYGSTKICTYDPGYTSTACCTSTITYIDGGKGVLLYRGYPIEQLAEKVLVSVRQWTGKWIDL